MRVVAATIRNRLIWPATALADQGHDVEVDYDHTYRAIWQPRAIGPDQIIGLADPVDADVVVLQRPLQRHRVELIDALQAQGIAVVVEIDDDFHAIHRLNPAWRGSNPLSDPDHNRDWLKRACDRADLVTVSTPALAARYGAHGRVRVLPNCIPERYLSIEAGTYTDVHLGAKPEGVTVGWSGSVATHPRDLQETGGGVARAVAETGARFEVVGTGKGVKRALGLDVEPTATGWLPLEAYPEALARFDVGIVPLLASEFNEAKSWLKGLEYAAVGVPFVASPTGEYRELERRGAGITVETAADWRHHVGGLASSDYWRSIAAEQGREVARTLTVEANAWRWAEAWADALTNSRERIAA